MNALSLFLKSRVKTLGSKLEFDRERSDTGAQMVLNWNALDVSFAPVVVFIVGEGPWAFNRAEGIEKLLEEVEPWVVDFAHPCHDFAQAPAKAARFLGKALIIKV